MKTHKNLRIWNDGLTFVASIYKLTNKFPEHEKFGLTKQLRRAAVSIPSNIAEGAARKSTKDYIRFLYISLGSVAEIETQLIISKQLEYIENATAYQETLDSLRRQISAYIRHLENKS